MATFSGPAFGKRSGTTRVGTNRDGANIYLIIVLCFSVSLYSGYRQDARITARPRKSAPTCSWRLSQNPGSVLSCPIQRACLMTPIFRHLVSLRSCLASCQKVSFFFFGPYVISTVSFIGRLPPELVGLYDMISYLFSDQPSPLLVYPRINQVTGQSSRPRVAENLGAPSSRSASLLLTTRPTLQSFHSLRNMSTMSDKSQIIRLLTSTCLI